MFASGVLSLTFAHKHYVLGWVSRTMRLQVYKAEGLPSLSTLNGRFKVRSDYPQIGVLTGPLSWVSLFVWVSQKLVGDTPEVT